MIQAHELRIGNKVVTLDEEPEIITIDEIDSIEKTIGGNALRNIPMDSLSYISITEECLIRLGLQEYHKTPFRDKKAWSLGNDEVCPIIYCDGRLFKPASDGFICLNKWEHKIDVVHLLQNACFALTGDELQLSEIKNTTSDIS